MKFKFLPILPLIFASSIVYAYTQSDLLNAQTNFQSAKINNEAYKNKLTTAEEDSANAQANLRQAESALSFAKSNLKQKQESVVQAKQNLANSNTNLTNSGLAVDNIWSQINGKVRGSTNTNNSNE